MRAGNGRESTAASESRVSMRIVSISRRELLVAAGGAAAGALLAGCGGGGGGTTREAEITIFANLGDPTLATIVDATGVSVTYFGTKDAGGLPASIDFAIIDAPNLDPARRVWVSVNNMGLPVKAFLASGATARFTYPGLGDAVVTVTTADGATSAMALYGVVVASRAIPSPGTQQGGLSSFANRSTPTIGTRMRGRAGGSSLVGTVDSRCGLSFINADITGFYKTDIDTRTPIDIVFMEVPGGGWQYCLPALPDPPLINPQPYIDKLNNLLTLACTNNQTNPSTAAQDTCAQIMKANPSPELAGLCALLLNPVFLQLYCNSKTKPGTKSTTKKSFASTYYIKVNLDYPERGANESPPIVTVHAGEAIAPIVVNLPPKPTVGEVVINPPMPRDGGSFTISDTPNCTPDGTLVRISVAADSLLVLSQDLPVSAAQPTVSVTVPPQKAGTRIEYTVKILPDGPAQTGWFIVACPAGRDGCGVPKFQLTYVVLGDRNKYFNNPTGTDWILDGGKVENGATVFKKIVTFSSPYAPVPPATSPTQIIVTYTYTVSVTAPATVGFGSPFSLSIAESRTAITVDPPQDDQGRAIPPPTLDGNLFVDFHPYGSAFGHLDSSSDPQNLQLTLAGAFTGQTYPTPAPTRYRYNISASGSPSPQFNGGNPPFIFDMGGIQAIENFGAENGKIWFRTDMGEILVLYK